MDRVFCWSKGLPAAQAAHFAPRIALYGHDGGIQKFNPEGLSCKSARRLWTSGRLRLPARGAAVLTAIL
jgi:hypothetical protein